MLIPPRASIMEEKPLKSTTMDSSIRIPESFSTVFQVQTTADARSPPKDPIEYAQLNWALCGSDLLPSLR